MSFRIVVCGGLFLIGLLGGAPVAPAKSPSRESGVCSNKVTVPLDLDVAGPAGGLLAGSTAYVQVTVRSRSDLAALRLVVVPDGPVELSAASEMTLDPLAAGQENTVRVPVRYPAEGRASLRFEVVGTSPEGEEWTRARILYTLFTKQQIYSGTGGFVQLELAAVDADMRNGLLSQDEALEAARRARTLPGTFDQAARPIEPLSPEDAARSALIRPALPGDGSRPEQSGPTAPAGGGCITVQGNVSWLDENGNAHPAFGITVQVWDEDLGFDEFVAVMATDVNGNYSFLVDNDDGIGAGDRDIYVKFVTANNAVSTEPDAILSDPYEADSPVHDETPCGAVITENFTCDNTGTGPACSVNEAMSWIAVYVAGLNGNSFLGQITIEWPTGESTSNYDGSEIAILELDRWDWDVMHHEYGHYIMDSFDFEDNPGGDHGSGDCASSRRGDKDEGTRLAWGESWPTYDGTVAQQVLGLASLNLPRVGDVSYQDTEDLNISYSLESQGTTGGEDNEAGIQRLFWDLHDTPTDGRDQVDASHADLFNIVNASDAVRLSQAWAAIRGTLSNADQLAYGEVAADHGMGPTLVAPAAGVTVSPSSNNNFSWSRAVGCSGDYDGDDFTLRFFRTDNAAPILSIPVGNTTTASLTLAQLQTLVATTHNVTWAVEGRNTSSPATGPYLGESFAIVVNQPPVADAGPDQPNVECTSSTTTPVQLNGTGSSDPDGDNLTYTWSATGVTFDDPNSATPIGQFPMGTTVVTLVVSDGIEQDNDTVQITVVDTTPPSITCPADTTVECNDHCEGGGVPSGDPSLADFFSGVSATDICDTTPDITDNRPDCFPVGTTEVTFTACDDDLNCASCKAKVTVVDTTPPEITVVLNRNVLWPPNHLMSPITATVTVTDICDPNPTFVLTSISSDEPDNGLGDGDMPHDIQNADYGTADVAFDLRSERSGTGDGRIYTIIYTASDISGNTAEDTVYVRVPHDKSGAALAASGFNTTGTAFESGADSYRLLILSREDQPLLKVDAGTACVGNHLDVVRPIAWSVRDVNGDRLADVELVYPVKATLDLRARSGKLYPLGLHYTSEDGSDWLVANIFDLGATFSYLNEGPAVDDASGSESGEPPSDGATNPSGHDNPPAGTVASPGAGPVVIEVFDVTGRKLRTVTATAVADGRYEKAWDGRDDAGRRMPSGMYFYRITTSERTEVQKIRIVR